MGYKDILLGLLIIGCASAQTFRVCVPTSGSDELCPNLDKDGSQIVCTPVPTRIECALRLAAGTVDAGVFSQEELLLLAQRQPNDHRVVATIRTVNTLLDLDFEAVAVVPNTHTNGFDGLSGGRYCHPGLGPSDLRWSPRVLRTLESLALRNSRCPSDVAGKTAEEVEVESLSNFFANACRPGPWSSNSVVDADLKSRYPNLCSMCTSGSCAGYSSVNFAGGAASNSHIQALDCLTTNGTVAFAAWTHVQQYFTLNNPTAASSYSLLCDNGTLAPLSQAALSAANSPCALVKQPWGALVATNNAADTLSTNLRTWFPAGDDPGGNTWQSALYTFLAGGAFSRVVVEDNIVTPSVYTANIRTIPNIDSTTSCTTALRWCTVSAKEQEKCGWVRSAAYSLGLQPTLSCQQRAGVFECLKDIQDNKADFFSADSHYGYLAREHYRLSPVKLVQNARGTTSRVAVLVNDASTVNISRFENLRDKVACFPEFGGIAYVAFLRAAQQNGVISETECDYARAIGELVAGGCTPGAIDTSHSLSNQTDYDATSLCSACKANDTATNYTCAFDASNLYFGNRGSLLCLTDPATDFAVVEVQNIVEQLSFLNLQANSFRALCANNTLAPYSGVTLDDECLIAHVVDAEVLMRRNDALANSTNTLLDGLDEFFGYNPSSSQQLINLRLYSPFDGVTDILFKDSTIGLTEPSINSTNPQARNYIELFQHLEDCTNKASDLGDHSTRLVSLMTLLISTVITRFVIY